MYPMIEALRRHVDAGHEFNALHTLANMQCLDSILDLLHYEKQIGLLSIKKGMVTFLHQLLERCPVVTS